MKKITLVDKNGKNRVYIVNNKTQLKRALPYRNPKIVKEEPLPDTIKPAKDQKLYIITGWTNSTELDDLLAAVQRRGYPVSIKTRPMHTEYGFLISDKGLKDLEAKVQYPVAYKKYQIDQESYPIIWNNLSWYYEDEWNKWHKQSLPESKMKNYTIKNYKGNLLESVSNFQKKYPKSHIIEAREQDGLLKIKVDESFTKTGELHFDENGECKDNIKPIWHHIHKYPKDKETIYANGNTYIYCVAETSGLTEHFWAVYEGQDVRSKSDTQLPVPDYLIKRLPESVKTNESLNRREEDELYYDVLNWFYDNLNDIPDKQWKDLVNGVDKNADIFTKMLEDLKMQNADDEVKDKIHEFLVDFIEAEF